MRLTTFLNIEEKGKLDKMSEEIRRTLIDSNPWWEGNRKKGLKERALEEEIAKYIDKRQIISVTGLRRCGKTSLFYRLINQLLDNHEAENILYFSFDGFSKVGVREILDEYEKIHRKSFKKEKIFIFLDEVQKLDDWQEKVKRIYDNFENLKIFVSGSESLFFRKSKESLAGRIFEFHLNTLTFPEFLDFRGINYEKVELKKGKIRRAFEDYLLTGGFPELAEPSDEEFIQKYLRESVIEKIIFRDIPEIFPVRNPSDLETIFNLLIDNPAQVLSIQSISSDLDLTRQTASKYLKYLEMSYLIKKAYNYSKSGRKRERKLKKYYLSVPALSLLRKKDLKTKSRVFEALLALQVGSDYFWRSGKKEVDLVAKQNDQLIPIEVKYRDRKEYSGLFEFMDRHDIKRGTVITKDMEEAEEKDGKKIGFIPGWKFLLENVRSGKLLI